jgi:hypothetical protein
MSRILKFGIEGSHADYVIPIAIIRLKNAKGGVSASAYTTMYIRMGGTFSTAIRAAYDDAQGIVGTPFSGGNVGVLDALQKVGPGFVTGLQAQILKGFYGAGGVVASAGMSGRQQAEFLSRVFLSNFQQVVYRGPSFRLFTLPFVMKPTSKKEAIDMQQIIFALKVASSPRTGAKNIKDAITQLGGSEDYLFGGSFDRTTELTRLSKIIEERNKALKDQDKLNQDKVYLDAFAQIKKITDNEQDFITESSLEDSKPFFQESPITFGYPDTCTFELALVQGSSDTPITTVFKSDACVIENVVTDYGSSNKMTFFQDDYYPTEVTLTLNLKELVFQTADSLASKHSTNPNLRII